MSTPAALATIAYVHHRDVSIILHIKDFDLFDEII